MSEQLEPFEVFIASLSVEQQKVFWKELQNADFYDIMEDHLFQNQYVKMIAAKEKIDSMRAVESVSDVEQGETDAESDKDSCSENSFPSSSAKDVMEDNLDDMVEQLEDLQKRSPNNIEILLLGESGVGKSTMINAFSNYMKYLTYKTAENNSLQVHVKGTFTLVDNEMNSCVFDFGPKVPSSTDNNDISKSIKAYEVPISEKLPAKSITFLDTAGFGSDSDATESEFEEALEFARNGGYVAVLILLQPNMARLTPFLQIFLRRTLEACKASKVYFCFTKSQMTMYRFGETFSVLKSFLVDRKSELVDGLEKRCFCFENESFKYLRVRKEKGFLLHESQIRGLTTSWNHSKQTMFKLLDSIISKIEERKPEPEPEKDVEPAVDSDLSPPPPKLPRLEESKKPIEQYTQDLDARFSPHVRGNLLNEWKQEPNLYDQENVPHEQSKTLDDELPYRESASTESKLLTRRQPPYSVYQINEQPEDQFNPPTRERSNTNSSQRTSSDRSFLSNTAYEQDRLLENESVTLEYDTIASRKPKRRQEQNRRESTYSRRKKLRFLCLTPFCLCLCCGTCGFSLFAYLLYKLFIWLIFTNAKDGKPIL